MPQTMVHIYLYDFIWKYQLDKAFHRKGKLALSLKKSDKIENFENQLKHKKPWIFND